MPRTTRVAPGGMLFHVLNRGEGRLHPADADYRLLPDVEPLAPGAVAKIGRRLGAFMQKLSITHARNWQEHRRRVGYGHLYQGRYKSFPVENDEHFYQVVRYVERNALRAGLVRRAENWRWSSLWRRQHGSADERQMLSDWPVPMPKSWKQYVNQPQSEAELAALRVSLQRGQPYGGEAWVRRTAEKLGLQSTLRPRGRPKIERDDERN